jgi:hypothetical protein
VLNIQAGLVATNPFGRGWCPFRVTDIFSEVVSFYRGHRIGIVAQLVDGAWTAGVRRRRTLSEMKPHVEQVTCRQPTAIEVQERGEVWARRWVDLRSRMRPERRETTASRAMGVGRGRGLSRADCTAR